jgi:aminopeptidase YwaD
MQANGAADLITENLSSTMGHGDCAVPALLGTVEFFKGFIETSVDLPAFHTEISLYPNPTTGRINVSGPTDFAGYKVQVVDISGKIILDQDLSSVINLDNLRSGMYLVRIIGNQGVSTHRVIRK